MGLSREQVDKKIFGDRYEVLSELGRGGMGVVFACHDRITGSRVAIKCVDRIGTTSVEQGDTFWFHQEARALASLSHPSIVYARDFGTTSEGIPYLVMDWVRGERFETLLRHAPLPWALTWAITDQILAALAHAHARGVIHGDLKPQNLMVDISTNSLKEPHVYMLDFGLSYLLRNRHDPRLDGTEMATIELPHGGGTVGFMAPEQIRRAAPHIGPATDLYALGCILFQMLTGHAPYEATKDSLNGPEIDEERLLQLHKSAPIPSVELPAGVPDDVAIWIDKLLAKRPWRRFEYAGDLRVLWEKVRPTELMAWVGEGSLSSIGSNTNIQTDKFVEHPEIITEKHELKTPTLIAQGAPELLGLRPTPLIGRIYERFELTRLVDQMTSTQDIRHRIALLVGEAGVGKSRVAEWLCEQVHETSKMVPLRARYRRVNSSLDGLNGAVLSHYGLERIDRILVEQALMNYWEVSKDNADGLAWVAATAEWLRPSNLVKDTTNQSERRNHTRSIVGPTGLRFALDDRELRWRVVQYALERIGHERPILLWCDDLHFAPNETFEFLEKFHQESKHLRIFIIATVREEATGYDLATARRIARLARILGGPRLHLGPLDTSQIRALLEATLPLDEKSLCEAEKRSKGNPLFALQLLHAWAAKDGFERTGSHYRVREEIRSDGAQTTGELWDEKLALLSPQHQLVAEATAALGNEFRGDIARQVVAQIVGLNGLGVEVTRTLDTLQRTHILVAMGGDRFRFTHTLLQEHLLTRLFVRKEAQSLFRIAAYALDQHPFAETRRVLRHRVLNRLRAQDGNEAAKLLLESIQQAWLHIRDASETLEDIEFFQQARDELRSMQIEIHPNILASLQRWKAEALRHAGNLDEAREVITQARKVFAIQGNEIHEAHSLRLLGHIRSEQGDSAEGRQLVTRALAIFDRHNHEAGRASCELVLGEIGYLLGEHSSARDHLYRAVRRLQVTQDSIGRGQGLLLLALIELTQNAVTQSFKFLNEAYEEFESVGYRLGLAQCSVALAHTEHRAGHFTQAHDRATDALTTLQMLANPRCTAGAYRVLAMLAIDQDHVALASTHSQKALELYEQLKDPWGIVEAKLLLVQIALIQGSLADAEFQFKECTELKVHEAEPQQHYYLTQAWLSSAKGDFKTVEQSLYAAQRVFQNQRRVGDHSTQLLQRFITFDWPTPLIGIVHDWVNALALPRSVTIPQSV